MSHRPEQVASVIRRAVQEALLRGINDPRVRGMVSVTRVTVDPDLAEARIHVSVLPAERATLTLAGLRSAAPHLERRIRGELHARRMPHLRFDLDDSLKKFAAIEASIEAAVAGSAEGSGDFGRRGAEDAAPGEPGGADGGIEDNSNRADATGDAGTSSHPSP